MSDKIALERGEFPMAERGYQAPSIPPAGAIEGMFPRSWNSDPPPGGSEYSPILGANQPVFPTPPAAEGRDVVDIEMTPRMTASQAVGLDATDRRPGRVIPVDGPPPEASADVGAEVERVLGEMLDKLELVNLTTGEAKFMGHVMKLRTESLVDIKTILAQEVYYTLQQEQARVLEAVQQPGVQASSGGRGPDVRKVPGPEGALEPAPKSGERAMS